ncbi:glucose-1-phosphate adenylyltransferase [Synechococcus sp. PCC 7336]|uniref:glucose-1-phosphate adenylyltransferase n=1 Tax=Synechococcus sp. PCC 7336 TaxID=195250 RepID=UPI000346DA4E|nr:glucose-1-phosphate adenylyltransferase [Synechococcus sp. PCC 7336]
MRNVLSIILGGGRGTRLYPLTKRRAKPAVPLAGKYRLIDIPVSNCINSGIQKMYVLTQFNSASLNRHLVNTYRFSPFSEGFVDVLAAEQTAENPDWFQGTADAVRQYLWLMESWKAAEYLILSGDHLYRMDYRPFIEHHRKTNADVTLSVIPIDEARASAFGLMKIDRNGRVIDFEEKPEGEALKSMQVDTQSMGLDAERAAKMPYIASMGIYVFRREALVEMLKRSPEHTDFGKEVIPAAMQDFRVQAYLYKGYWEDIGTIEAFYRANLSLTQQPSPPFSFYDAAAPIFTRPRFLPPNKILGADIRQSIVCDGCIVKDGVQVSGSILGVRSRVETNTVIENTLVMGSDEYESPDERQAARDAGLPPLGIGPDCHIRNAIIDKNSRIGRDVRILNKDRVQEAQREDEGIWIRDGIVCVVRNSIIPDGTSI